MSSLCQTNKKMTYANKKQPHIFARLIGKIHLFSWGEQDTFDEMIMMSALFLTNTLSWILIVLAH